MPWLIASGIHAESVAERPALPGINYGLLYASRVSFLATLRSRAPSSDNPSEYGTGCSSYLLLRYLQSVAQAWDTSLRGTPLFVSGGRILGSASKI